MILSSTSEANFTTSKIEFSGMQHVIKNSDMQQVINRQPIFVSKLINPITAYLAPSNKQLTHDCMNASLMVPQFRNFRDNIYHIRHLLSTSVKLEKMCSGTLDVKKTFSYVKTLYKRNYATYYLTYRKRRLLMENQICALSPIVAMETLITPLQ